MSDVQADIDTVTALQVALMRATQPHRRGVHPKMHAFVDAEFEVPEDVPDQLRIGLFAKPARYRAQARFSNGGEHDDAIPDIHGIGFKLFGVPGRKALDEAPQDEHDFVLSDHPVFFAKNAADYAFFMRDKAQAAAKGEEPTAFLNYLKETDPVNAAAFVAFTEQRPVNLLGSTYWSQTPFAYGDAPRRAARFQAIPQDPIDGAPGDGFDYLRERMVERLAPGRPPVIFDVQVQIHDEADEAVIENPTVEWDIPFTTVGRLIIPAQDFDTPERRQAGEAIRLTSWNAVHEQRPIGEMNEIRKIVYLASQKERVRTIDMGRANLLHDDFRLTRDIDDEFKRIVDGLRRMFAGRTRVLQGRASHTFGVAGRGTARFVLDPDAADDAFFSFGRTAPVTLRHANPGQIADDRMWTAVGASLKVHDKAGDPGVLDLLMDSGRRFATPTLRAFAAFMAASPEEKARLAEEGLIDDDALSESFRTRGSFIDSYYHGAQSYEHVDGEGVRRIMRFRLIPGDRGPERGAPPPGFRADGLAARPAEEGDARAPDHLRQDWRARVRRGDARYLLQAQARPEPEDMHAHHPILNAAEAWDEKRHPWRDVAEIRIETLIDDAAALAALDFNPNRSPAGLSLPLAVSPDDYASIGHARALLYGEARAVRAAQAEPQAH